MRPFDQLGAEGRPASTRADRPRSPRRCGPPGAGSARRPLLAERADDVRAGRARPAVSPPRIPRAGARPPRERPRAPRSRRVVGTVHARDPHEVARELHHLVGVDPGEHLLERAHATTIGRPSPTPQGRGGAEARSSRPRRRPRRRRPRRAPPRGGERADRRRPLVTLGRAQSGAAAIGAAAVAVEVGDQPGEHPSATQRSQYTWLLSLAPDRGRRRRSARNVRRKASGRPRRPARSDGRRDAQGQARRLGVEPLPHRRRGGARLTAQVEGRALQPPLAARPLRRQREVGPQRDRRRRRRRARRPRAAARSRRGSRARGHGRPAPDRGSPGTITQRPVLGREAEKPTSMPRTARAGQERGYSSGNDRMMASSRMTRCSSPPM